MEITELAKRILKLVERIAKALEKIANKDDGEDKRRSVRGFNPGGTD